MGLMRETFETDAAVPSCRQWQPTESATRRPFGGEMSERDDQGLSGGATSEGVRAQHSHAESAEVRSPKV